MLMFLTMEADCIREALHKLGDSDSSIFTGCRERSISGM